MPPRHWKSESTRCSLPVRSNRQRRCNMPSKDAMLVTRPEIHREPVDSAAFGVVEKPLSTFEKLHNIAGLRKTVILLVLALTWEIGGRLLDNDLLFPTFFAPTTAFIKGIASGELIIKIWASLTV